MPASASGTRLGERVRSLRVASGLTQTQLAGDRFSKEYISQIERGKTRPTETTIAWLAEKLGVDSVFLSAGVSTEERARIEAELERAEALSAAHDYEDAIAAYRKVAPAAPRPRPPARAPGALQERGQVRDAMELPQPRVALGLALRGIARSAIDVSDGLLGDLSHLLQRSAVGATVEVDTVPRSDALRGQSTAWQRVCTLAGGDDYELVFSAAPADAGRVHEAAQHAGVAVTRIGRVEAEAGLRLVDAQGRAVANEFGAFDHFKS